MKKVIILLVLLVVLAVICGIVFFTGERNKVKVLENKIRCSKGNPCTQGYECACAMCQPGDTNPNCGCYCMTKEEIYSNFDFHAPQ
jgi:flagellar basal body-associated protein FliL